MSVSACVLVIFACGYAWGRMDGQEYCAKIEILQRKMELLERNQQRIDRNRRAPAT